MDRMRWSRRKKLLIGFIAFDAIVMAAVLYMVYFRGDSLRKYVRQQVQAIAAASLNPTLTFEDFKYIYPLTVEIYNAKLTADTPDLPGGQLDIIAVRTLTLELAGIPRVGKPLVIQKILLDQPQVRLVALSPGGGGFYGFSNMVRSPADAPDDPPVKLSDVFELRLIDLEDGLVVYDSRRPGVGPMQLDKLTTTLTLDEAQSGWHQMNLSIDRSPQFSLASTGRMNLDEMLIELGEMRLATSLSADNLGTLPPQLQEILRTYQVNGEMSITGRGLLNLNDVTASDISLDVQLNKTQVLLEPYIVPIHRLDAKVQLAGQTLTISRFEVVALGGQLDLSGEMSLAQDRPMHLQLDIKDMQIDQAQVRRDDQPDQPVKYSGLLNASLTLNGPLDQITQKAGGGGEIQLTDARVIGSFESTELVQAGRRALELDPTQSNEVKPKESAMVTFSFEGDKMSISDMDLVGPMIHARGSGDVYFDQRLDLKLNAGPIEKMQSKLGMAGRIMGSVTDRLIAYRITGTFEEPKIGVRVLGVGAGSIDESMGQAGQAVGDVVTDTAQNVTDTSRTVADTVGNAVEDAANTSGKIIKGAGEALRGVIR